MENGLQKTHNRMQTEHYVQGLQTIANCNYESQTPIHDKNCLLTPCILEATVICQINIIGRKTCNDAASFIAMAIWVCKERCWGQSRFKERLTGDSMHWAMQLIITWKPSFQIFVRRSIDCSHKKSWKNISKWEDKRDYSTPSEWETLRL